MSRSLGRDLEPLRREREQGLARGRRRLPNLHAAAHDAGRAGGGPLVRRQRGIALDQLDLVEGDAEFFRRHLRNRRAQAGAEIDFAAVKRDRAIGIDAEESVDLGRIEIAREWD
jgi:hypothetical protein